MNYATTLHSLDSTMNANNYKIQKYVLELSLKEIKALDTLLDNTQDKDLERVGYIAKTILLRNDPTYSFEYKPKQENNK